MAKKKRKKKRPNRPATGALATAEQEVRPERAPSHRAERKELARRERERRIKHARRRQRMRRAARWGIAAGVLGAIALVIVLVNRESGQQQQAAEAAADRLSCSPVVTKQDEVDAAAALDQPTLHSPPFAEGQDGVPVTAGRHSNPLQPPPFVFDQPIPEANAVHNLEHGYVVIYYAQEGQNALAQEIRSALEDLVEDESNKVLMAPYPDLARPLDLVAWGNLRTCEPDADDDPDDAVTVTRAFIDDFRSGGLAPEPQGV